MKNYSKSHDSLGYGEKYKATYEAGYYSLQWSFIEKPLLISILEKFKNEGSRSYLDFACGTGRIIGVGEKVFGNAVGVDISNEMAQHARTSCPTAEIYAPFDICENAVLGNFDVITSFRFFLNAELSLRKLVLSNLALMQKPGQHLIVNIHVNSNSILGFFYTLRNFTLNKKIANVCSLDEMRIDLEGAGYKIIKVNYYSFFPRIGPYLPVVMSKVLIGIEKIINKIRFPWRSWAQSFIIIAEKI